MANLIFSALPNPRRPVVLINPDVSVASCIEIMKKQNIGCLVLHDSQNVLGTLSERDIVRGALDKGTDLTKLKASDIAFGAVTLLSINEPVEKAMEAIIKSKRRHILITENNDLVAVLSIGDLLFYLLKDKVEQIEQLKMYIQTDGTCKL